MNAVVPQTEKLLPMASIGLAQGAGGTSLAPQNLAEVVKFAEVMSRAGIALPKHLRGNPGACMAVALQAMQWEMNPFAVAAKSYSVNDLIAYEAQLIAAVVNTRSGIKGRLRYEFEGDGQELWCRVTGTLDGQDYAYESPMVGAIHPKNSPLWKSDPRQQLGYYSARAWARRYTPEVILGVYDRDEVAGFGPDNARDVSPQPTVLTRLQARAEAPGAQEGFDPAHVTRETELLASGAPSGQDEAEEDQGSGIFQQPASRINDGSNPDLFGSAEGDGSGAAPEEGDGEQEQASAAPSSLPDVDPSPFYLQRMECIREFVKASAIQPGVGEGARLANLTAVKDKWKAKTKDDLPFVESCLRAMQAVVRGKDTLAAAKSFLEDKAAE